MNSSTLILLALGGYLLYNKYKGSIGTGSQQVTPNANNLNTPTGPYTTPTTPITVDLQKMLGVLAGSIGVAPADMDTMAYYFQAATGKTITSGQMDQIISYLGGDRNSLVDSGQFFTALSAIGYYGSGLGYIRNAVVPASGYEKRFLQ